EEGNRGVQRTLIFVGKTPKHPRQRFYMPTSRGFWPWRSCSCVNPCGVRRKDRRIDAESVNTAARCVNAHTVVQINAEPCGQAPTAARRDGVCTRKRTL